MNNEMIDRINTLAHKSKKCGADGGRKKRNRRHFVRNTLPRSA